MRPPNTSICDLTQAMLSIATCCLSWIFMIVPDISKAIMTSFSSLLVTALASAYIFLATQASLSPTVRCFTRDI